MVLVVYAAIFAIFCVCLYALLICFRISVFNDFRFIKDVEGSPLESPQSGKYKFAALYGITGISGIALLFYEVLARLPFDRWSYVVCGFLGVFVGARGLVIWSHKRTVNRAP